MIYLLTDTQFQIGDKISQGFPDLFVSEIKPRELCISGELYISETFSTKKFVVQLMGAQLTLPGIK